MHELSLAMSMRDLIEEKQQSEQFTQVTRVVIEIGALSHVEAEAMKFCFSSAMRGSAAEDAQLELVTLSATAKCPNCQNINEIKHLYDPCENCGSFGLDILQGDQVRLKQIEVV